MSEKSLFHQSLQHFQMEELIQWTQDLVRIPSLNPPGLEAQATDYLEKICHQEGLLCQRIPSGQEGRENLWVVLQGQSSQGLAFTGHQDVVPVSEAEAKRWLVDPFSACIQEGFLYGRGSADMKGGLMAALYALVCVQRSGILPPQDLHLLITCDEENHMIGSKALFASGLMSKISELVVCEPTHLNLCRIGKGRTWGNIEIQGQTAHGSQQGVGQNAVELASDLIQLLRKLDWSKYKNEHGSSFIRCLAIQAGVEPQVVPDTCKLTVDARLTTGHSPSSVWLDVALLLQELQNLHPGCSAEVHVEDLREPWITAPDSHLVQRAQKAAQACCSTLLSESVFAGTTDGTVLRREGCETLILGPGDLSCVHRENEKLSLDELQKAAELYLHMMCQGS